MTSKIYVSAAAALAILSTRKKVILAAVLIFAVFFVTRFLFASSIDISRYQTSAVVRGNFQIDISATGTVEPEEVVDVGAQVGGLIVELGKDKYGNTIDYGSAVDEGTVLARIDPTLYETDVEQTSAQVKRAKADLLQFQAKLIQSERDWKRAQKLGPSDALARSSYDSYQATYESAKANVAVAEAQLTVQEAEYNRAVRNLNYCTIKSPVAGVIIDRRINIGQTVVSSFNAPSLFLIAKDLRKMELWVSVNEADVGKISPGQQVTFTVDAFPGEIFKGEVRKVRLNASMTNNVVTYIVEVSTDNSSGRLLPYLTANARFEIESKSSVLLIPNQALRFKPSIVAKNLIIPQPLEGQSLIWVIRNGKVDALAVTRKNSDGVKTEIESSEVQEGDAVITSETISEEESKSGGSTATNPFTPNMQRGRRN